MNDYRLNDPTLLSLEAQLAGQSPQLSAGERDKLLYRCAFTAGQESGVHRTRLWQGATLTLAILVVAVSIPLAKDRSQIAKNTPEHRPTNNAENAPVRRETFEEIPRIAAMPVDAWQVQEDRSALFAQELARLNQMDSPSRSLTVGAMARRAISEL